MTTPAIVPPDVAALRAKFFPFTSPSGFTIKAVSVDELRAFLKTSFDSVFPDRGSGNPFQPDQERAEKMWPMMKLYEGCHQENFLFYDPSGEPVGWHMGEAEDPLTFYMRNTGVLPRAQNSGLYKVFFKQLISYLTAIGYERITSQHQATNRRILILKLKEGFDIAGMELTERWGPLVKLVKLLPTDRREAFYKHYGMLEHLDSKKS